MPNHSRDRGEQPPGLQSACWNHSSILNSLESFPLSFPPRRWGWEWSCSHDTSTCGLVRTRTVGHTHTHTHTRIHNLTRFNSGSQQHRHSQAKRAMHLRARNLAQPTTPARLTCIAYTGSDQHAAVSSALDHTNPTTGGIPARIFTSGIISSRGHESSSGKRAKAQGDVRRWQKRPPFVLHASCRRTYLGHM